MLNEKYHYDQIKEKYQNFKHPMIRIIVNGKDVADNKSKLVISDLEVDLSTGFEASVASFSIFNTFDKENGSYSFSKFKSYVALGSAVSIETGYSGQLKKIFSGFISNVRFCSNSEQTHHVEVTAMDVKGLMMSGSFAKQLKAENYAKAVKDIFSSALYQKMQSEEIFTELKISATPDQSAQDRPINQSIEMVSESDYEFVVKAAKRFNYEFFVDTGVVYFRKAKDTAETCLMSLKNSDGIFGYDISYDITGLVKKVEVRGVDTAKGSVVSAVTSVSNKISKGNKAKSLINKTQRVVLDANAVSKDMAKQRAESVMEEISYRFGSLTCECIGMPELMPGHFIKIDDLGEPCETSFYVTHTKHTITDYDGYHIQLTAKAAAL